MPGQPHRPLRLLTFTTLFPNGPQPNHGVFVANRLQHLVAAGAVHSTVLAPVPWFPSSSPRFGRWAQFARVAGTEQRDGLTVHHPRYLLPPVVGMSAAPALLFAASARYLARLLRNGSRFDAIDAHYLYPDGVAAALLGRRFGLPVVITARGSDVTQLPGYALPRRMIQWAMQRASALIAVSAGLRGAMVELGADPGKVTVLRNGVDLDLFRPQDRDACRAALGLTGPTLISVGHLIPRKGHHHTITALADLPDWQLLILGEGPERAGLEALAASCGVGGRVRFLGARPHAELPRYYSAADVSVLASSREGWANVLLESMACGTPVVASDIPGNPEVVTSREAGLIVERNTPDGFADAIRSLHSNPPSRAATRAYAEGFSWDATSTGQLAVFRSVLSSRSDSAAPVGAAETSA